MFSSRGSTWTLFVIVLLLVITSFLTMYRSIPGILVFQTGQSLFLDVQKYGDGRSNRLKNNETPHLAVTICADRFEEPMTMIKSAVLFSHDFLIFHIITDSDYMYQQVDEEIGSWPREYRKRLKYIMYNATYPADVACPNCKGLEWKSLFAPCSSQRLFLSDLLADVDSVLYVDADTLFFAPVVEVWSLFYVLNSTQFIGAGSITDRPKSGIYHEGKNIPFYGPNGVNAGVLLMNLTRMRASTWVESAIKSLEKYEHAATHFDQDLINIYMHDHPEHSFLLPCDMNVRSHQCIFCRQVNETGITILHGFLRSFVGNAILPFKGVYSVFYQFKLGKHSIEHDLLRSIKRHLNVLKSQKSEKHHDCNENLGIFTKRIELLANQTG